jgi:branched-chain amino acid aminotransferase
MDNRLIWLNGKIVPLQNATINVLSPTAQFGANVFEGIRCYWSEINHELYAFRLDEHCKRLLRSIKLLRLNANYTAEDLTSALKAVVQANNYKEDIAVRQTVFVDGFGSWSSQGPVNMFVAPIPKSRLLPALRKGLRACFSTWTRISDRNLSPKIKCGANYMNSRMAQLEAVENGYDTALFLNEQGTVAEGVGSCICLIIDNKLITPPGTASVLESITRDTLLVLANELLNMEVEVRDIDRTEVYAADEVFLCGSGVELTALLSVDGYTVGAGTIGPLTTALHDCYLSVVTGERPEYHHWLTSIYE